MKKMILCLTFLTLFLTACSKIPSTETTISETTKIAAESPYLFTNVNEIPYIIHTETARARPLCPDPLCIHTNEACPFYQIDTDIDIVGERIYYLKECSMLGYSKQVCCFDMKSGNAKVLYEAKEASLFRLLATENYIFWNVANRDKDGIYSFRIMRHDLKRGKTEIVSEKALSMPQTPINIKNSRVYWKSENGEVYSTDISYQNRIDGDTSHAPNLTSDCYAYKIEATGKMLGEEGYRQPAFRVIGTNLATGETTVIFEELGCFPIFYDDSIIYAKLNERKFLGYTTDSETGEHKSEYDKYGGIYYICDADGKNERMLCSLDGTNCIIPITSGILGGKNGANGKILVRAQHYKNIDENETIAYDGYRYLLIDIKTGEVNIIEIPVYS